MSIGHSRATFEARLSGAAIAVRRAANSADSIGLDGYANALGDIYIQLVELMQASLDGSAKRNRRLLRDTLESRPLPPTVRNAKPQED